MTHNSYEFNFTCPICSTKWNWEQASFLMHDIQYRDIPQVTSDIHFAIAQEFKIVAGHFCMRCRMDLADVEKRKVIKLKLALKS